MLSALARRPRGFVGAFSTRVLTPIAELLSVRRSAPIALAPHAKLVDQQQQCTTLY